MWQSSQREAKGRGEKTWWGGNAALLQLNVRDADLEYMAWQGILYCSPIFIFCHFTKLIISWLLIVVFLINFLSWRKTSSQKYNDCFQIHKIGICCKNRITFSLEILLTISAMTVTRSFWEISFLLRAVAVKKTRKKRWWEATNNYNWRSKYWKIIIKKVIPK